LDRFGGGEFVVLFWDRSPQQGRWRHFSFGGITGYSARKAETSFFAS